MEENAMQKQVALFCVVGALFIPGGISLAQTCPDEIRGGWEGHLPARSLFKVSLAVEKQTGGEYSAHLDSPNTREKLAVRSDAHGLRMRSERFSVTFEGRTPVASGPIDGFISYASNLYRITLAADGDHSWSGTWSPLPVDFPSLALDLYFNDDGEGGTGGYFFFRDERLPSLYGLGARCTDRHVEIGEKNLGLTFSGELSEDLSGVDMNVSGPAGEARMVFTPMSAERLAMPPGISDYPPRSPDEAQYSAHAPENVGDGWRTASPSDFVGKIEPLVDMVGAVARGDLPGTHSILLAKSGYLIVEEYFYGFDRDMVHDLRSASKSLASTLVGLAIDRGLIGGADDEVLPYFPDYRTYEAWDEAKAKIRIRDLMTMSSGLDANDSDRSSVAAEGAYQSQSAQPDWVKLALDAPMIAEPGTRVIYGGANPLIIGGILDNVTEHRLEWFAENELFGPLGIEDYRIYQVPTGVPYLGGGMYLRPRDMLKIGQMYLDGGQWQGRKILSEAWVVESFGKYGRLEPLDRNGNEYGYLWWHESYDVNGQAIDSIDARGNGGQYIFIVPELDVVAVITSGNYRGGLAMTRQPQEILRHYLLPALVN